MSNRHRKTHATQKRQHNLDKRNQRGKAKADAKAKRATQPKQHWR